MTWPQWFLFAIYVVAHVLFDADFGWQWLLAMPLVPALLQDLARLGRWADDEEVQPWLVA